MKKLLLSLSILSITILLQAQNYVDSFQGQHLVQVAEKIIDWTQQPGLISVSAQVVDSMHTEVYDLNTAQWQPDERKYYSYQEAVLQKELSKIWQPQTDTWKAAQQSTFFYMPDERLEKSIRQVWHEDYWQPETQTLYVYNDDERLVKTYQQTWQTTTETWEYDQISQPAYYDNGLASSLTTSGFAPATNEWQQQYYQAFVYKDEHPWLSEEVYFLWDSEQHKHHPLSKAVCFYSSQLLKGVEFYHWDDIAKDWAIHAQAICSYDDDFQLIRLDVEQLLSDGVTWEYEAECRFHWGETLVSAIPTVATDDLYLVLPNPYQSEDFIRLQRGPVFLDLDYHLVDMQGRLCAKGEVPVSGEWRLPAGLEMGLYVLVVGDGVGEVLVSRKIVVQ